MAKLMHQYAPEDLESQNLPSQTKVQLIIDVEELSPKMIIDRGMERLVGLPHYQLALTSKNLGFGISASPPSGRWICQLHHFKTLLFNVLEILPCKCFLIPQCQEHE